MKTTRTPTRRRAALRLTAAACCRSPTLTTAQQDRRRAEQFPVSSPAPSTSSKSSTSRKLVADRRAARFSTRPLAPARRRQARSLPRAAIARARLTAAASRQSAAARAIAQVASADPEYDRLNRLRSSLALGLCRPIRQPAARRPGIAALRAAAVAHKRQVPADSRPRRGEARRRSGRVRDHDREHLVITVIKSGAHFANPWLRAIVLSPSVHRFLTTLALGERDMRSLACADDQAAKLGEDDVRGRTPIPACRTNHFSGAAIVFVSTVNYPTRTASLQ